MICRFQLRRGVAQVPISLDCMALYLVPRDSVGSHPTWEVGVTTDLHLVAK